MESVLKKVHSRHTLTKCLLIYSHAVVAASVTLLVFLLYGAWRISELTAAKVSLILAVPFIAVSLLRRLVKAPRPYELYDFYGTRPKIREGESFPSRHAFSAFAIGTAALPLFPVWGSLLLVLGVGMCIARVLLGIHFVRDVAAGALCGLATSLIGLFIIQPFAL